MSDATTHEFGIAPLGDDYHDTIALLQEEIARLEDELRARDGAAAEAPAPLAADHHPEVDELRGELESAHGELAARDEAIAMLLEQTHLFEEAEAASRAEWEQLHAWVEEVERRVGSRDDSGDRIRQELDAERRRAEAERQSSETDRRSWALQRKALEEEVERLRGQLARVAAQEGGAETSALAVLAEENQRLRATCEELAYSSVVAAEVEPLREQLRAAGAELDEARSQLRQALDDGERMRIERDAEIASLRSQLALRSLAAPVSISEEPAPEKDLESLREADERIRTLRQHLREIHEQEERERSSRRLSSRLSRLWRQTGPA